MTGPWSLWRNSTPIHFMQEWSSWQGRPADNREVAGSNPAFCTSLVAWI